MAVRTPRRRISPRAKRRYRAIREFFRRALGNTSQQEIKISSSIAVNVSDLKHRIIGIEHQLSEVNRHCQDLAGLETSFRREAEQLRSCSHVDHDQQPCRLSPSDHHTAVSDLKQLFTTQTQYERFIDDPVHVETQPESCACRECRECSQEPSVTLGDYRTQIKTKEKREPHHSNHKSTTCKHRCSKNKLSACLSGSRHSVHESSHCGEPPLPPQPPPRMSSPQPHCSRTRQREHEQYIPLDHNEPPQYEPRKRKHKEKKKKRHHDADRSPSRNREESHHKRHKERLPGIIDRDFITDIIKRQYQPIKLFGRRGSDLSQFSAPVCRDHEYRMRNEVQEGTDLCSCCYDERRRGRCDFGDARSVCDTRLYSSRQYPHHWRHRRREDIYNDAQYYDVIPVKEKSSPKSRRKFVEENVLGHPYGYPYKEVPPSPRTHRPRLNLKAQYFCPYDDESSIPTRHEIPRHVPRLKTPEEYYEVPQSDDTSLVLPTRYQRVQPKLQKSAQVMTTAQVHNQASRTSSNLQYPSMIHDHTPLVHQNINTSPVKVQDKDTTDRALCEIKDILQNFLHEIKKDTSRAQCEKSEDSASHSDKPASIPPQPPHCAQSFYTPPNFNTTANFPTNPNSNTIGNFNANANFNANGNFNSTANYNASPNCTAANFMPQNDCLNFAAPNIASAPVAAPCIIPTAPPPAVPTAPLPSSFVPPFVNPYCYSMMCPVNYLQNGYLAPSPSVPACETSSNNTTTKDVCVECSKPKDTSEMFDSGKNSEIDDLVKEIYKYVAKENFSKRVTRIRDRHHQHERNVQDDDKELTSRSVGDSFRAMHDVKVGTPRLKCFSKSCEAFGSRGVSDHYTSLTHSDTVLEKLSIDSSTHLSTMSALADKKKVNKIIQLLRAVGFSKKKKKLESTEDSELESVTGTDSRLRSAPFRQSLTSYMMHGTEYYQRPPVPPYARNEYQTAYDHRHYRDPESSEYAPHRVHRQTIHEHASMHYEPPSAPPYPGLSPYEAHMHGQYLPQPPLCLKEVEVRSTSTQSDKKFSFFQKRSKHSRPKVTTFRNERHELDPRTCSTQTQIKRSVTYEPPKKSGFFATLKNLQNKTDETPEDYGYKAQKQLANGDVGLRNMLIKKLFYKKNPFSPSNMLVRKILGKDQTPFLDPTKGFDVKRRMFY